MLLHWMIVPECSIPGGGAVISPSMFNLGWDSDLNFRKTSILYIFVLLFTFNVVLAYHIAHSTTDLPDG